MSNKKMYKKYLEYNTDLCAGILRVGMLCKQCGLIILDALARGGIGDRKTQSYKDIMEQIEESKKDGAKIRDFEELAEELGI